MLKHNVCEIQKYEYCNKGRRWKKVSAEKVGYGKGRFTQFQWALLEGI